LYSFPYYGKFTAPFGVWIYAQGKYVRKPIVCRILKLIAANDNIMCHAKEKKYIMFLYS